MSSHSGGLIHVEDSCVMGLGVFFLSHERTALLGHPSPHLPTLLRAPPPPLFLIITPPSVSPPNTSYTVRPRAAHVLLAGCKGEVICITLPLRSVLLPSGGTLERIVPSRALNHGKYLHVNPRAVERGSGKTRRPTGSPRMKRQERGARARECVCV